MSEQKRNIGSTIPIILIPVFITTIIISMIALLRPGIEQKQFDELAELIHTTEPGESEEDLLDQNNEATIPADTTYSEPLHTESPSTDPMELEQYRAIHEKNPDTFGWIYIEGTSMDYPVMHTPDDPEHYLQKDFEGNYSNSGVPFMAAECFEGCGNYILYGHNMKNGSMFNNIVSYKDAAFMRDHPIIKFDTMYNIGEYEVYAVFYSRAYYTDESDVFRVYNYADLRDEVAFRSFTEQAKEASLYDTHVEASYGDQFITLITCSYHTENGRFIVVAVKHAEE